MAFHSATLELQVAIVSSDAEFGALAADWNATASRQGAPSVFFSFEWFNAAWAWRRLDSTLQLLVARRGRNIVGILPIICGRRPRNPRSLELLTVPDTQVCDLLAGPDDAVDVAEAFAAALVRRRDWDYLDLKYLPPHGLCVETFAPALRRRRLHVAMRDGGRNPFIALSGMWTDYYNTRSRRLKKANNLTANRLKRTGENRIDWLRSDSCEESQFGRAIDAVIDISGRSWKRETGNSLDQPGPQAFIRSLSRAARDRGWLSIWLMHVNGQPLAMEYQLIDGASVHALRSDFDASHEEISPGSYLFRQLLESSFGCGLKRYYMGSGDNLYKSRWTDQAEPLRRVIVYNRTLPGRFAWLRDAVAKPMGRAVRNRLLGRYRIRGKTT